MALTYTPNDNLGESCPNFNLPATDQENYKLEDFAESKVLVVMFICNHCPYVQAIEQRYIDLAHSYEADQASIVGICSNDSADYPEDSFENLKKRWQDLNYDFPYLHDEDQSVAKTFGAVCTPDIFVYDENRKLAYRGRFDDSWKSPEAVKNQELKRAIDELLEFGEVRSPQHPSMGCSIKWRE